MIARRTFLGAAATGLAAPFILRSAARAANPRVRRDVMDLPDNDPFFKKYGDAVRAMHKLSDSDGRNWIRQAKVHADFCKHGQLSFLQWHRHYINFFEAICGELIGEPDFALPYWNWSKKSGVIPAPFMIFKNSTSSIGTTRGYTRVELGGRSTPSGGADCRRGEAC